MYLLGGKIKPFQGCSYNILVLISDLPNCPVITVLHQPLFLFACRRVVIIYHSLPANVASFPGSAHALEPGNKATAKPNLHIHFAWFTINFCSSLSFPENHQSIRVIACSNACGQRTTCISLIPKPSH